MTTITVPRAYVATLLAINTFQGTPNAATVRRLAAKGFITPSGYAPPRNPWCLTTLGYATLRAAYPLGVTYPKVRLTATRTPTRKVTP